MKLNISYPINGSQKLIEVDDERKLRFFYDKRISAEVDGEAALGEEYAGYVFKISGGFDKQGFPMKQGVIVPGRTRLLLKDGHSCFRPKRTGERKRKSVRGCIVGPDLSVLSLVVVKRGPQEIAGLTDRYLARRLGPKRASKIRKLFKLAKEDDVRQFVIRREIPAKEGKSAYSKAPKIQRLVTPVVVQRKRHRLALKKQRRAKTKEAAQAYAKMIHERNQAKRNSVISKKRSARESTKVSVTKK